MSYQPGYGHPQKGDITGWARTRTQPVRPPVPDRPAAPRKVRGRLSAKTTVQSVDYPSAPAGFVAPFETPTPKRDLMKDVERKFDISAMFQRMFERSNAKLVKSCQE